MELATSTQYRLVPMDAARVLFSEQTESHRPTDAPHVTEILRDMEVSIFPPPKRLPMGVAKDGRQLEALWDASEIGFIWEELLSRYFRPRMLKRRVHVDKVADLIEQETYRLNGIYMTPDAVDLSDQQSWWLEEYKSTRKSIRKWEDPNQRSKHFYRWLKQILSYMKVTHTLQCRLFVYWVCGDWMGRGAETWTYELHATQEEVDENWRQVLEHGKHMGVLK